MSGECDEPKNEEIMYHFVKISEFVKTLIKSKSDLIPVASALFLIYEAIREEVKHER